MKALELEKNKIQFIYNINNKIQKALKPFCVKIPCGKNIRSELVFLFGKSFNMGGKQLETIAFALEGIHAGSLMLDDLIDKDIFRRGKKALWKLLGKKKAVSLSFLLFSRCLKEFHSQFPNDSFYLMKALEKMSLGESSQIDSKNYLRICYQKTGVLFLLSCLLPAVISCKPADELKNIYLFGKYFGIAYQLKDDYEDHDTLIKKKEILKKYHNCMNQLIISFEKLDMAKEIKSELNQLIKQVLVIK